MVSKLVLGNNLIFEAVFKLIAFLAILKQKCSVG